MKRIFRYDSIRLLQDPLNQRLSWITPPSVVLIIKKNCSSLFEPFLEIIKHLVKHKLKLYIEKHEFEHDDLQKNEDAQKLKDSIHLFALNEENLEDKIDLVVCLGGDGTLLHVSTLFQKSCPPVLSIHMGSLGFLCPFDFENFRSYVDSVLKGNAPLLLRNRLACRYESKLNKNDDLNNVKNKKTEWISMNEIVVERGLNPYLSNIDLFLNDYLITTVQGDGLIISTPTGSTAYAMAAGASMCHPSVPAVVICPICPHSLSFRPIVVPMGVELKIALGKDARNTAACSVDGHRICELTAGDSLVINAAEYPLPSICRTDQISDWFESLGNCLHWNQRKKQFPLDDCFSTLPKSDSVEKINHNNNNNNQNENPSS